MDPIILVPGFLIVVGLIIILCQRLCLWHSARKKLFWAGYWTVLIGGTTQWLVLVTDKKAAVTSILAVLCLIWLITGVVLGKDPARPTDFPNWLFWLALAGLVLLVILAKCFGEEISFPRLG